MKIQVLIMTLCLGIAAVTTHAKDDGVLVYVGTRGALTGDTATQGIYAARFDASTGKLAPLGQQLALFRTSWVVTHPSQPIVFVANNPGGSSTVESNIYSFAVDKASGKLQQINQAGSGGKDTTHVAFDAKSNTLFGASFASGDVNTLQVQADGSIGKVVSSQKNYGTGPNPRQNAPHAHAVAIDPTRRYVVSADLGADRIFVYRFDSAKRTLAPAETPFESTPAGSGPRHLVFHPNGKFLYVNTEMTAEVRVYRWDAKQGRLQLVEALPAYPAGYAGHEKSSSEIGVSRDGRFVYVTLRGDQDSIVVYEVNRRTGALKETQRIASQGKSPRSFGIDPTGRWMLVAHDVSNAVNVFGIDKKTGKLSPTSESVPVPGAAMITFYPN